MYSVDGRLKDNHAVTYSVNKSSLESILRSIVTPKRTFPH